MKGQIINLLEHKENKILFSEYLGSLDAEIKDVTNIYEAARFRLKGETCVIYYKQKRGIFSYSNDFAKSIHQEWLRGGKVVKSGGVNKENDQLRKKVSDFLGNLKEDPEFVRYIKHEFKNFDVNHLYGCELQPAYDAIKQYRELFLKEELTNPNNKESDEV